MTAFLQPGGWASPGDADFVAGAAASARFAQSIAPGARSRIEGKRANRDVR
jgi:hypothetical protein